jgi:hypothetical protein
MNALRDVGPLIDRLVDGELPESDRRALLDLLDAEPDGTGWRRCALAFLEAQSWREALKPVAERSAMPVAGAVPNASRRRPLPHSSLAVAAGIVAAFGLGWLSRGGFGDGPTTRPVPLVRSNPAPREPLVKSAGTAETPADPRDQPAVDPTEPVVRAWESRGFEVERRQRMISLGLDNGRRMTVPVNELRLRYIGDRMY